MLTKLRESSKKTQDNRGAILGSLTVQMSNLFRDMNVYKDCENSIELAEGQKKFFIVTVDKD